MAGQRVESVLAHVRVGDAVGQLQLGDTDVSFSARFGGNPFAVRVPIGAVAAIYAKENGAGTAFAAEPGLLEAEVEPASADERPTLAAVEAPAVPAEVATASDQDGEDDGGDEPPPPAAKKRRGSHLKVVK